MTGLGGTALAVKPVQFLLEMFPAIQRICTRILQMDRFHITSWYKFTEFLKKNLVESDKFSRNRSTGRAAGRVIARELYDRPASSLLLSSLACSDTKVYTP